MLHSQQVFAFVMAAADVSNTCGHLANSINFEMNLVLKIPSVTMTAEHYIHILNMLPHPEGGYYKETFRSPVNVNVQGFDGERSIATSIYFLLKKGQSSALHRIKSDEIWYFHDGDGLHIIEVDEGGNEIITTLGKNIDKGEVLQHVVKANRWFGARLSPDAEFILSVARSAPALTSVILN